MITLRMREEDWNFLLETLQMDAKSSAFDPQLRAMIKETLKEIAVIDVPEGWLPMPMPVFYASYLFELMFDEDIEYYEERYEEGDDEKIEDVKEMQRLWGPILKEQDQ